MKHGNGLFLLYRKLRRISCKAKKRSAWIALRRKRNLSLRDPPQAENPAKQDSIFTIDYSSQLPTVLGNGITSRMLPIPVRYITQRSKPRPNPE